VLRRSKFEWGGVGWCGDGGDGGGGDKTDKRRKYGANIM
jgi:hypothetical protein